MAMPILTDEDRRKVVSRGLGGNTTVQSQPGYDPSIANRPDPAGYTPPSAPTPTNPTQNIISQSYEQARQEYGSTPNIPGSPGYSQSAADQLRRAQAWEQIQTGRREAGLSPAELQAMKNSIANQMSSASSSAERMARDQAARAGTLGGGASDRRLQELAAMNQGRAASMMSQVELDALQKQKDREFQYAGMGAETASQFGRDELGYQQLGEQALMDRLRLQESARQSDTGNVSDMYRWRNLLDLQNRYREQERDEYKPLLDEALGRTKRNQFSSTMAGIGGGGWGR